MSTESEQQQKARKAAEKMANVAAHTAAQTRSNVKAVHPNDEPDKTAGKEESQPHRSKAELRQTAQAARAELASTLDAIEYKLNVPKQVKLKTRRANDKMKRLGTENPPALMAIALGAAAVVGTAVWLGVRALQNR
ncbi:DUF3618 domain-containing protein [Leifsonia sp. A12D58]|uniref:DUF3618 domain-containing protein n=1 Tax=Leifsonia sp. A12D58 TaxID=3397674 RepID=UPI0039E02B51